MIPLTPLGTHLPFPPPSTGGPHRTELDPGPGDGMDSSVTSASPNLLLPARPWV